MICEAQRVWVIFQDWFANKYFAKNSSQTAMLISQDFVLFLKEVNNAFHQKKLDFSSWKLPPAMVYRFPCCLIDCLFLCWSTSSYSNRLSNSSRLAFFCIIKHSHAQTKKLKASKKHFFSSSLCADIFNWLRDSLAYLLKLCDQEKKRKSTTTIDR